jgi:xanthine dehydrogenase accessory factor
MDAANLVDIALTPAPAALAAEAPRAVLAAACTAATNGDADAVLAVVVDAEGSTYVGRGAAALFVDGATAGWLSGGCLEPEIARHAAACATDGRLGWLELDTRDDDDLLSGSSAGCRGRLRLALLPLAALPGIADVLQAWLAGGSTLVLAIAADGVVSAERRGIAATTWRLPSPPRSWSEPIAAMTWAPPPELLVFGAGPETASLLPALAALGWRTTLVERRPRWRAQAALADAHLDVVPGAVATPADAALVMNHHFELDREALAALADTAIPYVGLLGPVRRREDLFRVLSPAARASLAPRLRSPVGLDLGGRGAAAIALSIAAQLQAWRFGLEPR